LEYCNLNPSGGFFRSLVNNIPSTMIMTTLAHGRIAGKNTQYTDYTKLLNVIYFLMKISRKSSYSLLFSTRKKILWYVSRGWLSLLQNGNRKFLMGEIDLHSVRVWQWMWKQFIATDNIMAANWNLLNIPTVDKCCS
jgi:hypothetical protein